MSEQTPPVVPVPVDDRMATEPARTIGDMFADKTMIRPLIAAVVAVIAVVTGWVGDTAVIDNLTTIVTTVAVLYGAWSAQSGASARARAQAEATREAVYPPAHVADVAKDAARSGYVEVVNVPREMWGIEQVRREREAASGATRVNAP